MILDLERGAEVKLECFQMYPISETAVTLKLRSTQSQNSLHDVQGFVQVIEHSKMHGLVEVQQAYDTVTVFFDPFVIKDRGDVDSLKAVQQWVMKQMKLLEQNYLQKADPKEEREDGRLIEIPVCYDEQFGWDLQETATYLQMTPEELIARHSGQDYPVYMIGFAPGFPYLGQMDASIAVPRKAQPRKEVPEGSVGIGGQQTGIYPLTLPGGWNLIGRTPYKLFQPDRTPPSLLKAGDKVRFIPIDADQYWELKRKRQEGN